MERQFHTPEEAIKANIHTGVVKTERPLGQMILMGMMAGAFIALGGASSSVAVHGITDVGLARTITGIIFPVGLMMILLMGGELFTGNCLIIMAVLDKKVTPWKMLRNLVVIYLSNLAGTLIIDCLVFFSGQLDYTSGGLGAYTIRVALTKVTMEPAAAVASGILCNMLVCMAILMAGAANDVAGKILAVLFPICTFVIAGFEHCVANMFYIPAGILAATNSDYVARAQSLYGITAQECESLTAASALRNLIPVTLGNIIGGVLFIGVLLYCIYGRKSAVEE